MVSMPGDHYQMDLHVLNVQGEQMGKKMSCFFFVNGGYSAKWKYKGFCMSFFFFISLLFLCLSSVLLTILLWAKAFF